MALLPKEAEVIRSLDKLKREPITTDGVQDSILAPIYTLLMSVPSGNDGITHWFCNKAKPVVNEAAIFLLRLYAYAENPRVEVWKKKLAAVLHSCCECVQAFHDAKTSSRDTYFGAFSKPTLDTFFATLETWEVDTVLEAVKEAGIDTGTSKTLSDIPKAVLYHMLTTIPAFFDNAEILLILQAHPPAFSSAGWPVEVPPGILLLLFHERVQLRTWAQQQVVGCTPIPESQFLGAYESVFHAVTASLASGTLDPQSSQPKKPKLNLPLKNFFTMSPDALWSGVHGFLRLLPPTIFTTHKTMSRHFCQTIIAHLHDTGSHFPDVLRAFVYLVKKLGKSLWDGEDPDYPQVVFDSVKDNSAFIHLIQDNDQPNTQQPWFLEWFQTYIYSLWELPIFEDMLRKLVGFMCEELQHERFEGKRAMVMASILSTLQAIFNSPKVDNNYKTRVHATVVRVLDIHADIIVNVAFSSDRKDTTWQKPRATAQQLLRYILLAEASSAETTIFQLSDVLLQSLSSREEKRKYDLRAPPFHIQIWKKMYETMDAEDSEGVALLVSLLAPSAYLDTLSSEAFNPQSLSPDTRKVFSTVIQSVNIGLKTMRGGFLDMITQYTNSASSTPQAVQSMLRQSHMVKHVVALLLSPVDELQVAAQTLIGQAYDVDVRSDCFRALLLHLPVPSLNGLADFISLFNDCAPLFPEACSIAKSVVRCMTDVIEVLTNGHDGLLFDETFGAVPDGVRPHSRLPALWRLMCSSITVIFRRTPGWSKYYDPEVMIDWMRDALIFARDLLGQRRTFESACASVSQNSKMGMVSPRKPSQIGRQMLENLQPVLTESIRWLRLTDMELLHQSSHLVQSLMDCFRETEVRPSQDALTKLEKFLDSTRRQSSPDAQTRLSEAHLSELTEALSFFNQEDDEEIQIVGEFKPGNRPSPFTTLDGPELAGDYRSSVDKQKLSVGQKKLDGYISVGAKASVKTSSISSSRARPDADIQVKRGTRPIAQPNSLMAQARSQAAAQGGRFAERLSRTEQAKLPQKVSERSQPKIKDETGVAKATISEVSSSSTEGSDEEDGTSGLASLAKLQKSPLIKKPAQRRTVKLLEPNFIGQNPALERIRKREEAQRAALRLKPDMKPLHRTILSWDYDNEGPEPPVVGRRPTYVQIADQFQSDKDYQDTFEPLLTLECWNQLIKSKEEAVQHSLLFRINSRQFIDDWLDLDVSITDRPPERWRLAETDIVLLRRSGGQKSVLAKVQSSRQMSQEIQATLRCLANVNAVDPGLHISSQWRLTKVFSLSTIAREFAALKALPYYDFYPEIMKPRPAVVPSIPISQVQHAMKSHHVNEPQAVAILGSLKVEGFSLIQGPPGTGKTWTICGLVGAFLSARSRPATVVHAGRSSAATEKTPPKKVLVCAPSNAAIDEVSKRLKDGVRNSEGNLVIPNIVRVGAEEAINISVKDISLDQLVDQRLNSTTKQTSASSMGPSLASLRAEMDALKNARAAKVNEMSNMRDNVSRLKALEDELRAINTKRMSLSQQFNRLKDQQKSDSRTLDAARRKHRAEVLMEADVICATLSGAGHEVMQNLEFDMVVIDEAAQSIELSSLIPLKYRSKRCIMVGDPQQLPPTVLSPLANKYGYGQSLFVRLQKSRPEAVHLLSIQYRMHPDISRLPSKLFYEKRLQDGPGMDEKTVQPWHNHPLFGTYKFVNVSTGREQQAHSGHSLVNRMECDIAVALYNRITSEFPKVVLDFRIGVIAMYRAQLLELKKRFQTAFGADVLNKVDFNTVDGFQGQEKDIIILSCVRAGPGVQSIGFLADRRRLNVAITRSRSSLFILGHAATLERSDEVWKEIVQDARGNARILDADVSTYRRPAPAISGSPHRRVGIPQPPKITQSMQPPDDLKTPKAIVATKSRVVSPVAGPSRATAAPVGDQWTAETTTLSTEATVSSIPQKRRNSEENGKRPAPGLRTTGDSQEHVHPGPSKPRPPPVKKRPKEVSMFIPKKKPDLKRPAPNPEPNTSHSNAKRRLTGEHHRS